MSEELRKLAKKWLKEQEGYPGHEPGVVAAAAVRLCAKELLAALQAAPPRLSEEQVRLTYQRYNSGVFTNWPSITRELNAALAVPQPPPAPDNRSPEQDPNYQELGRRISSAAPASVSPGGTVSQSGPEQGVIPPAPLVHCSNPKCDYTFETPGTTAGLAWQCPKCSGHSFHCEFTVTAEPCTKAASEK